MQRVALSSASSLVSQTKWTARASRSIVPVLSHQHKRPVSFSSGIHRKQQESSPAFSTNQSDDERKRSQMTSSSDSVALRTRSRGQHNNRQLTEAALASSVRHEASNRQFVLDLGDSKKAWINYRPISGGRIELYHTEVPEELRGRGIGKTLAEGTFESASKSEWKLKITCEYLQHYLDRYSGGKIKHLVD